MTLEKTISLGKSFIPEETQKAYYALWEQSGAFAAQPETSAQPYTIMMPPPNVTGNLHVGHALTYTLQDVLIRYHRMLGEDVLWQPGQDHAGIATQMIVERQLAAEKVTRQSLGRTAFIDKIWEWKAESGGAILDQMRALGASPDWSRERFTMDAGLSHAVRTVFNRLYKDGLIYRDKRLVNWDPKHKTAISDLEVNSVEGPGQLWYFKYPRVDDPTQFIVVASTRPETLFGDTAIAVHPEDERYKDWVGKEVMLPFVGRAIPIIADTWADPEKGSGAVKITPAHDFNDFEVGKRHGLPMLSILDESAHLTQDVPEAFRGLSREAAREKVLATLTEYDLLVKAEEVVNALPYGERSGVLVEPRLTDQWYVDAKTLAGPALEAVKTGRTQFVPAHWTATYYNWLENIEPWCISRQIWWGHAIPAWYGPDGHVFVAMDEADALAEATQHYGKPVTLTADADVLDTWFSSALWPFSTLGWPDATAELQKYYPTNVLVTGLDIIFFWVARMMMMGLYIMKDVPFKTVYMHAMVRDEKGQKMSKTKGNGIDPLEMINLYGADALRFTLTSQTAQGRDIRLSKQRVESCQHFMTKMWNASRYLLMNGSTYPTSFDPKMVQHPLNQWLVSETKALIEKTTEALNHYRFNEVADGLYSFIWQLFCDWYVEMTKPILTAEGHPAGTETRETAAWVWGQVLHLLHPVAPYISEELWTHLKGKKPDENLLIQASWPQAAPLPTFEAATADIAWIIELISAIRRMRAEMRVPAKAFVHLYAMDAPAAVATRLSRYEDLILRLARLDVIETVTGGAGTFAKGAAQIVIAETTFFVPLAGIIDLDAERARLQKDIQKQQQIMDELQGRLGDAGFVARAPAHIIDEQRARLEDATAQHAALTAALGRIGS